ncbi:MAG: FtsX-like permease family protein [Gemmatimonadetes bacterium]|nr:FtsX-like permease family protein [Gemmatimonadota bacterium]MYG85803.1 FtsX-like permease family protein [Gemmatimonadota bacterium]MYJ89781.1 FtsX-like permease family protein [Gemmatimonadota bacterium]
MLKSYITIAIRHMAREKGYTAINVLGLAVGLVCAMLIFLYVSFELSYDRYHEKADRLYRVAVNNDARTPPALGPALQADFPEITGLVRLLPTTGTWIMKHDEKIYYENRVYWADNALFDIFTVPLIRGDSRTALEAPYSVVISEDTARKYFGEEDPMGKTIIADNGFMMLTVTGVMENTPQNTHFQADFFISLTSASQEDLGYWSWINFYTYIALSVDHSQAAIEERLPGFVNRHIGEGLRERGGSFELFLQPVTDIHLHSNLEHETGANSDITYVYILSAIALFILSVACINFINLSIARFAGRTREVGLRKVFGAYRFQLIRQFLGESVLVTAMALVIALAAILLISPYFDSFAGKPVTTQFAGSGFWWLVLPAGALFVGLLSGSYPAMLLSAPQPVQSVKGGPQLAAAGGLSRKILVVIQFTISIAMIISTGILFNQMAYLQSKHPGFDKDRVIVIPTFNDVLDNFQPWKEALLQHTGVAGVTHSNSLPGLAGNIGQVSTGTIQRVDDPGNVRHDVQGLNVALDFVETLGMELLAGRSHSGAMSRDSEALNIVINETAQRVLGWNTPEEAIGQEVLFGRGWTGTVIGVVRDFHFRSMHLKIEPLVLFLGGGLHLAVRLHPGDPGRTLDYIENQWLRMFPDFPFAYTFLDENIERLYRSEVRIGYVFGVFALVAVFLACLGLFALVSFTMERRTREIGVRKALGASVQQVLALLSGEFVGLVLIANVLAWPAAWLTMQRWLESFAYRTEIGWEIFFLSGVTALLITLVTIGYRVVRTALANPADVLRNE